MRTCVSERTIASVRTGLSDGRPRSLVLAASVFVLLLLLSDAKFWGVGRRKLEEAL